MVVAKEVEPEAVGCGEKTSVLVKSAQNCVFWRMVGCATSGGPWGKSS